ncbi:hypothetical protein P171DRAFT_483862 [Karstenula rhodostoma CBS 690.94]|uniref:Uncharacterized protein n=1 Tax=Karstenula rhodostoma CBS 690.94 TaxID=1392251 RepID=A0A9P4PNS3_9PLEO|nr:hypothetical protein P171DRAFT_483862 [Karstenula rhodostoma CBS 690.94]
MAPQFCIPETKVLESSGRQDHHTKTEALRTYRGRQYASNVHVPNAGWLVRVCSKDSCVLSQASSGDLQARISSRVCCGALRSEVSLEMPRRGRRWLAALGNAGVGNGTFCLWSPRQLEPLDNTPHSSSSCLMWQPALSRRPLVVWTMLMTAPWFRVAGCWNGQAGTAKQDPA